MTRERRTTPESNERPDPGFRRKTPAPGGALAIGIGAGTAIGVAIGSLAIGIGTGVALAAAFLTASRRDG